MRRRPRVPKCAWDEFIPGRPVQVVRPGNGDTLPPPKRTVRAALDHASSSPLTSSALRVPVAATAQTAGRLVGLGYEVVVESGAGEAASFTDEAYAAAGAVPAAPSGSGKTPTKTAQSRPGTGCSSPHG